MEAVSIIVLADHLLRNRRRRFRFCMGPHLNWPPMKSKFASYCTMTGGILLMLFFIPHFFLGYPAISDLLRNESLSTDLLVSVQNIWIFSSITMLLCGVWGISLGYQILKTGARKRLEQLVLGFGITLFATIGWLHPFPNWQLFIFFFPGILILVPGLFRQK